MLPDSFSLVVVITFGLIIGSFLNVVIYRFHTGKSLNNRSHCLSCGKVLHWYELFPVFSYLLLRGRCRNCQSFIPYRYILVELLTALSFVLAYFKTINIIEFIILSSILSTLIVGLVYDLYHMIIPDEVSILSAALALLLIIWQSDGDVYFVVLSLLAAVVCFALYGSLWFFSKGKAFGLGDAKLSVALGLMVGLSGVFSFITLSFWVGAFWALSLIGVQKILHTTKHIFRLPRVKMKSEIPFAPFLIIAFALVYFWDVNVLVWMANLFL